MLNVCNVLFCVFNAVFFVRAVILSWGPCLHIVVLNITSIYMIIPLFATNEVPRKHRVQVEVTTCLENASFVHYIFSQ